MSHFAEPERLAIRLCAHDDGGYDSVHWYTVKDKILYLSLSSQLCIVEVRSAALFLSAQGQFRSQLTANQRARLQQFSLLRKFQKCA